MQTIKLHNGIEMPMEGFGVFQVSDLSVCERAVSDAIATGYRLIDTASSYKNETAVGAAIRKSGVPREDFFVTSKAFINEMGYERTKAAFQRTLDNLGFDYLDLYLVHMPFGDYYGAWRAMEELYKEGRIRAIGVSNFQSDRIIDLCYTADIKPMVNQLELHPFYQREEELDILREYGIVPQAWAPFAEGMNGMFTNPVLKGIAKRHGKTVAQIILRWNVQRGVASSRSPSTATEWKKTLTFGTLSCQQRISNKSHRSTLPVRRCSTPASRARYIGFSTIWKIPC